MRPNRTFIGLCAALAASASWVGIVGAQTVPDPADPAARVPAAAYRSAFAGYRPMGDAAVGDWRAANDEVGRIGGWRAYAREAQAPAEKPAARPVETVPAAPAQSGQGMHGMPGDRQ